MTMCGGCVQAAGIVSTLLGDRTRQTAALARYVFTSILDADFAGWEQLAVSTVNLVHGLAQELQCIVLTLISCPIVITVQDESILLHLYSPIPTTYFAVLFGVAECAVFVGHSAYTL